MNVFTKLLRFLRKMFFVILFFLKLFFLKGKARKASPERTLEPGTELELRLKLLFNLSGVFQYGAFRAWKNHKIALTGDAFGICEFFTILMKKPAATQLSKIYFSIYPYPLHSHFSACTRFFIKKRNLPDCLSRPIYHNFVL